jgi:HSP20 family protein
MQSHYTDFGHTFALMHELRQRMARFGDDFEPSLDAAASNPRTLAASAWPRINVFDGGSNIILKADVPGLTAKDVQVSLDESSVSISGERKVTAPEGYSVHRQERSTIKFSRSLTLACKVNAEHTTASVKDGVLTITLAKAPEAQPRQITVQAH